MLALAVCYVMQKHFDAAGIMAGMLVSTLILAVPFFVAINVNKGGQKHDALATAATELLLHASHSELTPFSPQNVVHQQDENFYWEQPAALWEVETHSEYVGGYGGMSVRVARGLYARTGGMRGHKESKESLDAIDTGTLYLSDKRLLFTGARGVIEIPYKKIGAIVPFKDGARIDRVNAKPMTFVTGDAQLPVILGRIINKQFAAIPAEPQPTSSPLPPAKV